MKRNFGSTTRINKLMDPEHFDRSPQPFSIKTPSLRAWKKAKARRALRTTALPFSDFLLAQMDAQSARRISALACQLTGGVGGITAEARAFSLLSL